MEEPIVIIQGDTFDLELNIHDTLDSEATVDSVTFVCKSLGIQKNFVAANGSDSYWYVSLTSAETSALRVGHFTFDITASLENGAEIVTMFHNKELEVKFKYNKWTS